MSTDQVHRSRHHQEPWNITMNWGKVVRFGEDYQLQHIPGPAIIDLLVRFPDEEYWRSWITSPISGVYYEIKLCQKYGNMKELSSIHNLRWYNPGVSHDSRISQVPVTTIQNSHVRTISRGTHVSQNNSIQSVTQRTLRDLRNLHHVRNIILWILH